MQVEICPFKYEYYRFGPMGIPFKVNLLKDVIVQKNIHLGRYIQIFIVLNKLNPNTKLAIKFAINASRLNRSKSSSKLIILEESYTIINY